MNYTVAPARPHDLPLLAPIELAAARLLAGRAPESVLAEALSIAELQQCLDRGHLWVALANEVPVGFAQVKILEPEAAHLNEIDVHPDHGRRGLGTRLVNAVCDWATASGFAAVTLTTFREVPWNMPWYARLGFGEISARQLSPALHSVLQHEAERGLDPASRVAMRRFCR